jgi:hypothetical protein
MVFFKMEDILWAITQESRVLQELRKDIRGIWDDEAARELNSQYLNPHESEDSQMLDGLNQQQDALNLSKEKLESAETSLCQAEEISVDIVDVLESTEKEINNAYSYHDTYIQYHSEAKSIFPAVYKLINQANNACG